MSETEGIVLSPQRRSFITGCQVSKDTSSSTNSNTTNTSSVLKDLKETVIIDETKQLEDIGKMYPNLVNPWPHRMFLKVSSQMFFYI